MYEHKPEKLIQDLKEEKGAAISYLLKQTRLPGYRSGSAGSLGKDTLESIQHDAVLLAIQKIKSNQFHPELGTIVSYTRGIIKYMILNECRSQKNNSFPLDDALLDSYSEPVREFSMQMERIATLTQILERMHSPCRELIRYRYLDPLPDQEVLEQNITGLSNLNSIRATRSECLKKLAAMASHYKHLFHEI